MADTSPITQKRELDKFVKFLVCKCVQSIVQSRLGEKAHSSCKTRAGGYDWFNLDISDLAEPQQELRKLLNNGYLNGIDKNEVCVEISLKSSEGETLILELWWIKLTRREATSSSCKYNHTSSYNRMGLLLKSLLCVTRITPAYRLSRNQGKDSHVICYSLYAGPPVTAQLGIDARSVTIGDVTTHNSCFTVGVVYRTQMRLSSQTSLQGTAMEVRDDHFRAEVSPRPLAKTRKASLTSSDSGEEKYAAIFKTSPSDISAEASPPIAAFGTQPLAQSQLSTIDVPFMALLQPHVSTEDCRDDAKLPETSESPAAPPDDYTVVLDPLRPAFSSSSEDNPLCQFYMEVQNAPKLDSLCDDDVNVEEELCVFEKHLKELESFSQSLALKD